MNTFIQSVQESFIKKKLQDEKYANDFYSALCNTAWANGTDVHTFSWREAGRLTADLRELNEDYLEFYPNGKEGEVTKEISDDFKSIGWTQFDFQYPELTI